MRSGLTFVVGVLLASTGCTHLALERRTVKQASTLTDLQYQQVLDNLAMFACNPDALAWHLKLSGGLVQIADQGSGSFTADIAAATGGEVTRLIPSAGAQRGIVGQWDVDPTTEADELELLKVAYRKALKSAMPEHPGLAEVETEIDAALCELAIRFDILPSEETIERILRRAEKKLLEEAQVNLQGLRKTLGDCRPHLATQVDDIIKTLCTCAGGTEVQPADLLHKIKEEVAKIKVKVKDKEKILDIGAYCEAERALETAFDLLHNRVAKKGREKLEALEEAHKNLKTASEYKGFPSPDPVKCKELEARVKAVRQLWRGEEILASLEHESPPLVGTEKQTKLKNALAHLTEAGAGLAEGKELENLKCAMKLLESDKPENLATAEKQLLEAVQLLTKVAEKWQVTDPLLLVKYRLKLAEARLARARSKLAKTPPEDADDDLAKAHDALELAAGKEEEGEKNEPGLAGLLRYVRECLKADLDCDGDSTPKPPCDPTKADLVIDAVCRVVHKLEQLHGRAHDIRREIGPLATSYAAASGRIPARAGTRTTARSPAYRSSREMRILTTGGTTPSEPIQVIVQSQPAAAKSEGQFQLLAVLQNECGLGYISREDAKDPTRRNPGLIDQAEDKVKKLQDLRDKAEFSTPWFFVGCKKDVPKCACYVGHYHGCHGDCYVWVMPDQYKMLRDFTQVILSLAPIEQQDISLTVPGRGAAFSPLGR